MSTTPSTNNSNGSKPRVEGQRPLPLPFQQRRAKGGWAEWVFRHRIGLLITVILYLTLAILFVTYRIVLNQVDTTQVLVELVEEEVEEEEVQDPEEIEQIQDYEQYITGDIKNKVSNESSKFNETLRDNKNTEASKIYEEAERVQREMAQNRANNEQSLREIEERSNRETKPQENINSSEGDKDQDAFVRGNVTTSFTLEGRTAVYIDTPAYKCWGGGQVLVNISVNRNGVVVAAQVEKATSTADKCLINEAIASAKACKFSVSQSAPDPQRGSILFTFVAQ